MTDILDDLADTLGDRVVEREHSPKGASSAERWMNCPGSAIILDALKLPETDEPDYRAEGIAGHEAAAHCLNEKIDAWEIVGQEFHGIKIGYAEGEVSPDDIQVYLDDVRQFMTPSATIYVEQRLGLNHEGIRPHPDFYGTLDFAAYDTIAVVVEDLKMGKGIIVEPEWNVQLMYYAYGLLIQRPVVRDNREVRIRICQPRAYHTEGPVREWVTTAGEIFHWAETELLPKMRAAEIDNTLKDGDWCRFCPAKLFCPLLTGLYRAAMTADPKAIPNFGPERIGREYASLDSVKHYMNALKEEVLRRAMIGHTVPGTKLVYQKSNRIFKEGAVVDLMAKLGPAIYTEPKLKSPAQVEEISPAAKKLVNEWAYMPKGNLTVALESDSRNAVKVEKAEDTFAHLIAQNGE